MICLPELFRSYYFCQTEDHEFFELAEPIPGPSTERLGGARRRTGRGDHRLAVREAGRGAVPQHHRGARRRRPYLGKYRKMHIPDDPHYYEKFYFTPGDLGFRSWDTQFAPRPAC